MLMPRRVKHRKQHHPDRGGKAKGGTAINFGEFAIQALEPAYVTNRQIESARIAMTRHIKRGGKVWINIYPDRPLTKKPAETRMGSGKGSPEWWIANVKPGRVLFELSGVDEVTAREAKEELFNLRFQAATGQLESHGRLRAVKKDIARIYTVVRERELGIRSAPGTETESKEVGA